MEEVNGGQRSKAFELATVYLENCQPTGEHCCRAVMFESGKIRRETWWPRVLKVRFCNFDYCFHSKTKINNYDLNTSKFKTV